MRTPASKPASVKFYSLIPSLDALFRDTKRTDGEEYGLACKEDETIQISLAGPAGSGKSVLAMHYAAGFCATNPNAVVMYISTDLSEDRARRQFENFCLSDPEALVRDPLSAEMRVGIYSGLVIRPKIDFRPNKWAQWMERLASGNSPTLLEYVTGKSKIATTESTQKVLFIDLQSSATGDDWRHLERLFGQILPLVNGGSKRNDDQTSAEAGATDEKLPRRQVLIVIDAIEGLDATKDDLTGGDVRHRRRQRLAQLVEATSGNAHVLYTLETGAGEEYLVDEEFVADVAIRLRRERLGDTKRNTIEVAKARGLVHEPGIHHLEIRDGLGTSSFSMENIDDPKTANSRCYVVVHHALSTVEHTIERSAVEPEGKSTNSTLSFSLKNFDDLLSTGSKPSGLPAGKVYAFIGEADTYKSQLARRFLAPVLMQRVDEFVASSLDDTNIKSQRGIALLFRGGRSLSDEDLVDELRDEFLIETEPKALLDKIYGRTDGDPSAHFSVKPHKRSLYYRRLPNRSVSAEQFYSIVKESLRAAVMGVITQSIQAEEDQSKSKLVEDLERLDREFQVEVGRISASAPIDLKFVLENLKREFRMRRRAVRKQSNIERGQNARELRRRYDEIRTHFPEKSFAEAWRVRVVIDDLGVTLAGYGLSSQIDLIVPALVDLLRLAGVTAIIVDTHSGGPLDLDASGHQLALRSRVDNAIFTWKVSYGGGTQVAIAAIPPMVKEGQVIVRELRRKNGVLKVHRGLELYLDVLPSQDRPRTDLRRVPLHLLVATDGEIWDDSTLPALCEELLREALGSSDVFSKDSETYQPIKVTRVPRAKLESFILHNEMLPEPQTIVAMVDEYWNCTISGRAKCASEQFLEIVPPNYGDLPRRLDDLWPPDQVEQLPDGYRCIASLNRRIVPFTWNFGLMLLRRNPWAQVSEDRSAEVSLQDIIIKTLANKASEVEQSIRDDYIPTVGASETSPDSKTADSAIKENSFFFWHEFFSACTEVSERVSVRHDREQLTPYELDMTDGASLLCLLLEVWFSTAVWVMLRVSEGCTLQEKLDLEEILGFQDNSGYSSKARAEDAAVRAPELKELSCDVGKGHEKPEDAEKALTDAISRRMHAEGAFAKTVDSSCRLLLDHLSRTSLGTCLEHGLEEISSDNENEDWISRAAKEKGQAVVGLSGVDGDPIGQLRNEEGALGLNDGGSPGAEDQKAPDGRTSLNACLALGLYLSLVMLAEVIDFEQFEMDEASFRFKPRAPRGDAVAGRYWYTTACQMLRTKDEAGRSHFDADDPFLPFALPGFFSTRGDWGLAVLNGSRSAYLGELAIEALSRTKAASVRMQTGLGLPVIRFTRRSPDELRAIAEHDFAKAEALALKENRRANTQIRTGLPASFGGRLATYNYHFVRQLGPLKNEGHTHLNPIYRSQIKGFADEHNLLLKGVCRYITQYEDMKRIGSRHWCPFGKLFDHLSKDGPLHHRFCDEEQDYARQAPIHFRTWTTFSEYFRVFGSLV